MNKQKQKAKQKKSECFQAKCSYVGRCLVFNGSDCIKQDGKKIPLWRSGEARVPAQRISNESLPEQRGHVMTPYFGTIQDDWMIDGR